MKTAIKYTMILTVISLLVYTTIAILTGIFNPKFWVLDYKIYWLVETSNLFLIGILILEQYELIEELKRKYYETKNK